MAHQGTIFICIQTILRTLGRNITKKREFCDDTYVKQSKNAKFLASIVRSHQVILIRYKTKKSRNSNLSTYVEKSK